MRRASEVLQEARARYMEHGRFFLALYQATGVTPYSIDGPFSERPTPWPILGWVREEIEGWGDLSPDTYDVAISLALSDEAVRS